MQENNYKTEPPSEGEEFLAQFFKDEDISFESEKRIDNLVGDEKTYRKADFYLTRYKMYVEFFGLYNFSQEHKASYNAKKRTYIANNIPCIYLYPENLGIIKHSFQHRMQKELKEHKMKRELFWFRCHLFFYDRASLFFWSICSIILLFLLDYNKPFKEVIPIVAFVFSVIFFQSYRFYKGYLKYFKN